LLGKEVCRLDRFFFGSFKIKIILVLRFGLGIEAVSPDLEKQGFLAVVFVNGEYSG